MKSSDEIYSALSKVRLAQKLDCTTQDLTTQTIDCPRNKLGVIIGKNGTNVAKIQSSCKVVIDVDKSTETVVITGTEASIQRAIDEIDKIKRIEDVEIEFKGNKNLFSYLTGKYVTIMDEIRQEYPNTYIDIARSGDGKLILQGTPEDVEEIKSKVFGLQLHSETRMLLGKEYVILLGKKGGTIDKLCSAHCVSIEVNKHDEENATAVITGPSSNVDLTMIDIDELLNDNKEVTEAIEIPLILRNMLLAEGGRLIKNMQSNVTGSLPEGSTCFISVSKDSVTKDHLELIIKARQVVISKALELTQSAVKFLECLYVKVTVDPYTVPRILGKGGETIRKLTEGKDVFVEVDKATGVVYYGSTTPAGLEEIEKDVQAIIENNSIARVKLDPDTLHAQYREFARSDGKKELNGIIWFDIDDSDSCIIVRGKEDDLKTGIDKLQEFIENNKVAEIPITDEDREALITGGKNSKVAQFANEMDVKLHIDRTRHVVTARGNQKRVDSAIETLNQFLHGGNGHSVAKITVSEQVLGKIIGKGGQTRKELEKTHEGVSINISQAHIVTIRGSEQSVANCKAEIEKMVASARVTETVPVSDEEKETVEKKEFAKKVALQTNVNVSISDGKVVIRGNFHDVRDAVSYLNEMLTGEYKTSIELDSSQFSKVRNTCRDPSHFDRMEADSGAKIELDMTSGAITVRGKRSNVKKAKAQLFDFLYFVLPDEIKLMKITKPLFLSVGQATALAEISASLSGVTIYLDRDLSSIVVRSTDKEKISRGADMVGSKIKEGERLAYVLEFDSSDAWILAAIIGKSGTHVASLRSKHPQCKIDVSKESRTITVVGESEEAVQNARDSLLVDVEKARAENAFILIPDTLISKFVGAGGRHVKEMSSTLEVEIQRVKGGQSNFKISGDAARVEAAKKAVDEWIAKREEADEVLSYKLEKEKDVPVVLGEKGGTARAIQDEHKCKIDIDRKTLQVTIKGETKEKRQVVLQKIKDLIAEDREKAAARRAAQKQEQMEALKETNGTPRKPSSQIDSNDQTSPSPTNSRDNEPESRTEYSNENIQSSNDVSKSTSKFVQVSGSKQLESKSDDKTPTIIDTSFDEEGTETGRNLFAMLISES
jgi:rRNA processing protein Krr1/Pno1